MVRRIRPDDLVIHFLNVGFGDNIVIELPADNQGNRKYGLVDCRNGTKTLAYLDQLMAPAPSNRKRLAFICATHPHYDHISGIPKVMDSEYYPHEFWDVSFGAKQFVSKMVSRNSIECLKSTWSTSETTRVKTP